MTREELVAKLSELINTARTTLPMIDIVGALEISKATWLSESIQSILREIENPDK